MENNNDTTHYEKLCVERYRSKLLDTSKRNGLISFKHSERSRQHIRVIDELPNFLYEELLEGKTLSFSALPEDDQISPDEKTSTFLRHLEQAKLTNQDYIKAIDSINEDEEGALDNIKLIERELCNKIREDNNLPVWKEQKNLSNAEVAQKHNINPSYEMPAQTAKNHDDAVRHVDKFIQTLLKPEEMGRKLSGLNSYIRTDIEESGVNTLYVAFGFLQWYESKNSDKPCLSPLLLLQLVIEKKQSKGGYVYFIKAANEEPEINLSISERLRLDFGIDLPEFTEESSPEDYLAEVSAHIKDAKVPKKEKWCIRRFITIGRFHFARLVMYHDLNENKWPGDTDVSTNEIVKSLFAGSNESSDNEHAVDYNIDTPEVEKIVPLLITPADASQHSALVDVMSGKNLAIKGPPGTGKSQTITNIIANALAKNKTVLFIAEKMAALNVVYDRLSHANLGPYCLELHSTKANKQDILKSIEARIELRSSDRCSDNLTSKLSDFKRHRENIAEYINALNSKFGKQNKPIIDYLWTAHLRKEQIIDLNLLSLLSQIKISFTQANLTESEITEHTEILNTISDLKIKVEKECHSGIHPWGFVEGINLDPYKQDNLKEMINDWKNKLGKIQDIQNYILSEFNISPKSTSLDLKIFLDNTEFLSNWAVDDLDKNIIAKLNSLELAEAMIVFVEEVHAYISAQEEIHSLNDIMMAISQLSEIEKQAKISKELDAETLKPLDIKFKIKELEEELKLLDKAPKLLLEIGKRFGFLENDNLDKIFVLMELPDYIASIPRDSLLLRTEKIIDESNAERLKAATETQMHIRDMTDEQEKIFDLSLMGEPNEIRLQAATLSNSGFFSLFNSSYRKAKKDYIFASKYKSKFIPIKAADILRNIASIKDQSQQIEDNSQLKAICELRFDGINTDFLKLQEINNWAVEVRNQFATGDIFTRNIRQWLLTAEIEELDTVRVLIDDPNFIALKNLILNLKNIIQPDTHLQTYIKSIKVKIENLSNINNILEKISITKDITFADITIDLPHLQKTKDAKNVAEKNHLVKSFFGNLYAGADTNIQDVHHVVDFIRNCILLPEIKDNFQIFFGNDFYKSWQMFFKKRFDIKEHLKAVDEHVLQTQSLSPINFTNYFDTDNRGELPHNDLIKLFTRALEKPTSLSYWISLKSNLNKAYKDIKGNLLKVYDQEDIDFESLSIAFEYIIYSTIAIEIYKINPVFVSMDGFQLEQARKRIKELDQEITKLQNDELCNALNKFRPIQGNSKGKKNSWTEDALINHEFTKKRGHIPIRSLMNRAGQSIQKIKPCFLMSPLTVAQYLEPGKLNFDLVVIDEASQMRPEDALGGLARAKQIIVVGDPEQLPPTSFFSSANNDDENDDDDHISEAIMDMAISSFRPSRILSRHYRSQHESLIAFSNYYFYKKSLILFPSPIKNPSELGIRSEYIGGTYTSKSNMKEVQAVVKAAIAFMKKHPDRSLGIATMNLVQKELIEGEMDRAFIEHPHASNYKAKWQYTLESFFVKNLESVQGDERDAIFISTVYGPNENGAVMQRFGPINQANGYRRLNVLFTRAKKNMVIFTSLKPEDIKVLDNSLRGIKALKAFLSFAAKGVIDDGEETHLDPDSDFEIWVKEKLESIGCEVHPQVGIAGYRIDLGVKHPKHPYGYLIGIECDGATYHSSKSVRERDVIRQQVLEGLGWRIYRIWSTDWFSNPVQEFGKLKNFIEECLKYNLTSKDKIIIPKKVVT